MKKPQISKFYNFPLSRNYNKVKTSNFLLSKNDVVEWSLNAIFFSLYQKCKKILVERSGLPSRYEEPLPSNFLPLAVVDSTLQPLLSLLPQQAFAVKPTNLATFVE